MNGTVVVRWQESERRGKEKGETGAGAVWRVARSVGGVGGGGWLVYDAIPHKHG